MVIINFTGQELEEGSCSPNSRTPGQPRHCLPEARRSLNRGQCCLDCCNTLWRCRQL